VDAVAGPKIIRAGTPDPYAMPHSKSMKLFKILVEQQSKGEIKVELYPSMQLGKIVEQIEGVQQGVQEMAQSTAAWFSRFYPTIDALELPYLVTDWDSGERMYTSEAVKKLADEAEKATGIKIVAWFYLGFRHVINNKRPIGKLEDLSGIKIRLQDSPVHLATFRALGANPMAVPWAETYQAIQTGVVDGLENSLSNFVTQKFYEIAPYVSLTSHFFNPILVYMNSGFYNSLTPDEEKIINNALRAAEGMCLILAREADEAALKELKAGGAKVNSVPDDVIKAMQNEVKPVYEKYGKKFEPHFSALRKAAAAK
jgi:tripartite ATP-independent transporter DctP family solute receptor